MDEDRGATRLIPLTRGLHTTVDADDYERLARHRWHAVPRSNGHGFYAARSAGSGGRIWMHREIAAPPSARIKVDHRNGDGLDNRRANLRAATSQQNNWNRCRASRAIGASARPRAAGRPASTTPTAAC